MDKKPVSTEKLEYSPRKWEGIKSGLEKGKYISSPETESKEEWIDSHGNIFLSVKEEAEEILA